MRTYKFCPCPMFDIAGTQRWLEAQSAKGLHIDTAFNGRLVGFMKGEPKAVRYRFDAAPDISKWVEKGTPAPDQQTYEAYREMGWEYVSNRDHFHIYAAEDPAAPELHTDPAVQAMSLKLVSRRLMRSLLWCIPIVLMYLYLIPRSSYGIYRFLIEGEVNPVAVVFHAWLLILLRYGVDYLCVRSMRRNLTQGGSIQPFSRARRRLVFVLALMPLVMVGLLCMNFRGSVRDRAVAVPLSAYTEPLELPLAEEILADYEVTSGDCVLLPWQTMASPENLNLTQSVVLVKPDGKKITGTWYVTRHTTAAPWIAQGYWGDSISFKTSRYGIEYIDLELDDAVDYAIAYRNHYSYWTTSPTIILCRGNTVIAATLDFRGKTEPVDCQTLAELLTGYLP